jgi:diguanylate cyclase (GGDEF)-like protein/PAS domain S-box-containing protein
MTERRRLESDLRRYHRLFEHANDLISVVGGDGTPLYTSPSSTRLLGYPDGYQPDTGVLGVVHPDDEAAATEELRNLIAGTRGPDPFVVRVLDAQGRVKHLECVGVNLLHEPDVGGVVITARDVSERQRLSELLAHRATHDDLTGLTNRTLFVDRLTGALARSARDGHRVAVCFVDLDDFKEINDHHGHAAGDELLVDVAERLVTHVRAGDEVARIGGDEFLVLLDPVDDDAHALDAAERLVEVVTGHRSVAGTTVACAATAGVAIGHPGEDAASLMARADRALYRAKAAGKARAVLDEP